MTKPDPSRYVITGGYNALKYVVNIHDRNTGIEVEIYRAGNHPADSQVYVPASIGVGLNAMRKMCLQTVKEMALERGLDWQRPVYLKQGDA